MLGNNTTFQKRTFLNLKEGKVVKKNEEGTLEEFSFIEGTLEGIELKDRTFRGEVVKYWYINLLDEKGIFYSLGFYYNSNSFKSIILSLASERGLKAIVLDSPIRIEPYFHNGYDKVKVYVGDDRLEWRTKELPPLEEVVVNGSTMKDSSKRMKFISSLVDMIDQAIKEKDDL